MTSAVHDEFRAVARDLLAKGRADWPTLAASGWLGLEVPEALGGAGATFAEVAIVCEELGRAAAPCPYLGAVVLGIGALIPLPPGPDRDDLLREAARGTIVLAAALTDEQEDLGSDHRPFRIKKAGSGLVLHGRAAFVPDADDADCLLLLAQDVDAGPAIVAARGLEVTSRPVLDETRRLGQVSGDGVPVRQMWRIDQAAVRALLDRAAVAVACDSLGLAGAMLDATVGYVRVREQFGRPVGSFQAVKHACADMLVSVSVARELIQAAVRALADGDPGASVAASMAKSYACEAAVEVAGKAMQLHGGIGYTWESGIHVYLKRALLNRSLSGSPAAHRRRLAARYPLSLS